MKGRVIGEVSVLFGVEEVVMEEFVVFFEFFGVVRVFVGVVVVGEGVVGFSVFVRSVFR